ncbi:MAG: hypothetical protein H7A31_02280 [Thermotogae bacterium]|nr:hypothetical protein [Thermotogota bacterium]HOO74013.1 hypothetical protein [Tepiditoga sp.]
MEKALIYYGYPSCIDKKYDTDYAVKKFSEFDIVVFPGSKKGFKSIENTSHEDHEKSKYIIKNLNNKKFGYIACGNRPGIDSCWNDNEIKAIIDQWKIMGVNGIFLDEFGKDYKNTDLRQSEIINTVKHNNFNIIINLWNTAELLERPDLNINSDDYYLLESFIFRNNGEITQYQEKDNIFQKISDSVDLRNSTGIKIITYNTFGNDSDIVYDEFISTLDSLNNFISADATGIAKRDYYIYDTEIIDYAPKDYDFAKNFRIKHFLSKYSRSDRKDIYVQWKKDKFGGKPTDIKI